MEQIELQHVLLVIELNHLILHSEIIKQDKVSGYSTKVVSDGMTQQDIDQIQAQNKAANDAAYQAS